MHRKDLDAEATRQGSNVSSELLQSFTENIANMMITGELFVGNWSAEKGAEIKVCRKLVTPPLLFKADFLLCRLYLDQVKNVRCRYL